MEVRKPGSEVTIWPDVKGRISFVRIAETGIDYNVAYWGGGVMQFVFLTESDFVDDSSPKITVGFLR